MRVICVGLCCVDGTLPGHCVTVEACFEFACLLAFACRALRFIWSNIALMGEELLLCGGTFVVWRNVSLLATVVFQAPAAGEEYSLWILVIVAMFSRWLLFLEENSPLRVAACIMTLICWFLNVDLRFLRSYTYIYVYHIHLSHGGYLYKTIFLSIWGISPCDSLHSISAQVFVCIGE